MKLSLGNLWPVQIIRLMRLERVPNSFRMFLNALKGGTWCNHEHPDC